MNTSADQQISVPIPLDLFLRLSEFLKDVHDRRDPVSATRDAIDYWIENASGKSELLHHRKDPEIHGYSWKYSDRSLFLPHGTQIRMPHKGSYYYASVEGDEIRYEGRAMTPGTLANYIAQGSRNAWICLWIKRPDDREWQLADELSPTSKA